MAESRLTRDLTGGWELSGDLTFDSVAEVLGGSRGMFKSGGRDLVVDLSAVTRMDSAGLALMLEWLRMARQHRVSIRFCNIPARIQNLAAACGVDRIFGAESFQHAA